MRLLGGILDDGRTVGQRGSHHDVHRCADGYHVKVNVGTLHPSAGRARADKVALAHLGAHGGKALNVLIDGAHAAKIAAAGHGDLSLAETAEQRADQIVGGADLVRQLLRDLRGGDMAAVDLHIAAVEKANVCAKLLKDLEQSGDVGDLGDILNAANAINQQGCGDDGNGGIFCAADAHFTKERMTALYNVFRHNDSLFRKGYR